MMLAETVEWAEHCCWLLAQTDGTSPLARREFAEFFDLPEPYLAKVLRMLVAGGVFVSVPGANGGYRLGRPAAEVTVLEVVQAVGGDEAMFRCSEIRQRGPVGLAAAQCKKPCGIAKVMHSAELAWRNELAATTVADLIGNTPSASARRAARWLGGKERPGLSRLGRP
jgi:Rrf2 family protein